MSAVITTVDIDSSSRRPRTSEMLCLPLDFINGFLFGISASRVKDDVRAQLVRYQRECYQVLADAFLQQETAVSPVESSLIQVREMALAIARLADEQIEFDRRLVSTETRLDKAASVVGDMQKRLTAVEQKLTPGTAVPPPTNKLNECQARGKRPWSFKPLLPLPGTQKNYGFIIIGR